MADLYVLVADKNIEFIISEGLKRHKSIGIRKIDSVIRQHAGRDGGVRTTGAQMLALERDRYSHALLVLDYEGSGAKESAEELERKLDASLSEVWGDRAKAIVVEPEVDAWIWGKDSLLKEVLGWTNNQTIRDWLIDQSFEFDEDGKPLRPKEALEKVLYELRIPRSSSLYADIACRISLTRCVDPAQNSLRNTLRRWFAS